MAKRVSLKGKGADIFFGEYAPSETVPAPAAESEAAEAEPTVAQPASPAEQRRARPKTRADAPPTPPDEQPDDPDQTARHSVPEVAGQADTTAPRQRGAMTPGNDEAMVETIRRAVRVVGKESATHRITKEERDLLAEIIYTYGRQGIRTSVNEIARIGINYLCRDYQENGSRSLLDRVLRKLND
jgi:hypothetical protein